MKNRKRYIILLLLAVILLVPLLYSYLQYLNFATSHKFEKELNKDLTSVISQKKTFDMKDVTHFEWDKMIVFHPYTARSQMERIVGGIWTNYSYLEYLLFQKTYLGKFPLDNDSFNKMIFMKGDKVIVDITFNRAEVDLTHITSTVFPEEAKFTIQDHILEQVVEE